MATWMEISDDCFRVAKLLRKEKHWRSCVSRAYYSTFAAIVSELEKTAAVKAFPPGWSNPRHNQIPGLVLNHLNLNRSALKDIEKKVRTLRIFRETADYRPGRSIDKKKAVDCIRDAGAVRLQLGFEL